MEELFTPFDATNQNVVFESDDASLATVTDGGFMTAISEGTVKITVTSEEGGFSDSKIMQILTPSSEFNWALEKPIEGTSFPDGNNVPSNLVDDDSVTRWSVSDFPQSATVDLLGDIEITQIEVTCHEDRAYQFIIEGASDFDGPYTTIVDRSNNRLPGTPVTPIINSVDGVEARFVRITVLGADVYTGPWVSLTELKVFGEGEETYSDSPIVLLSIEDVATKSVRLSPNPTTSVVRIEGSDEYDTVTIYDLSGREVIQREINGLGSFDISELQSGTYLVKLEGSNGPYISKLIKL